MRLLRWLCAALVALALLAAAALFELRRRYPPERIRELAIEKVEPLLGRELKIASATLGLRGLDLSGVEVSEAPDFAAGTFLKAERLSASWSLRALLDRRLDVSELRLSGFDCRLETNAKGELNAASLGKPAKAEASPKPVAPAKAKRPARKAASPASGPGKGAGEFAVSVSRIAAERGTLSYKDAAGRKARVEGLEALVTDFKPGAAFPVKLSFAFKASSGKTQRAGKLAAEGRFDPTGKRGTAVDLESLRLESEGLTAKLKGKLSLAPDGALALELAALELSKSGVALKLEGRLERTASGEGRVSLKGPLPALTTKELRALGASVPDGVTLPAGRFALKAGYAGDRLSLDPLSLSLGDAGLEAKGKVMLGGPDPGLGAQTGLDLAVKTTELPLESLHPLVAPLAAYEVGGKATLALRVTGAAASPVLAGDGRVAGLRARSGAASLDSAALALKFDPKRAELDLKGKLSGADLSLSLDAREYSTSPDLRVEGKLAFLDLGALMASKAADAPGAPAEAPKAGKAPPAAPSSGGAPATKPSPAAKSSGKFSIGEIRHPNFQARPADLQWNLTGMEPSLAQLGGKAMVKVGPGRFEELKTLASKHPALKVAFFPFVVVQKTVGLARIPLFPAFDKGKFKEIVGDYVFDKGVMTIKDSHMDSDQGYLNTTGTADLGRDRLDLRVAFKLGGLLHGKLSGPLAFYVRGSLSDPQVKPDVAAILKQPGVEQVLEGGKKLLQGIFK